LSRPKRAAKIRQPTFSGDVYVGNPSYSSINSAVFSERVLQLRDRPLACQSLVLLTHPLTYKMRSASDQTTPRPVDSSAVET
jgi:hypothetical protein